MSYLLSKLVIFDTKIQLMKYNVDLPQRNRNFEKIHSKKIGENRGNRKHVS